MEWLLVLSRLMLFPRCWSAPLELVENDRYLKVNPAVTGVVAVAVETDAVPALLECAAGSTAGVNKEITALLEGRKSDLSRMHGVAVASATAGESRNLGLRPVIDSLVIIHLGVLVLSLVLVCLRCLVFLRLLLHLLLLLCLLLLLHMRASHPCMMRSVRTRR